jgi:type VI secretion system secreted protein Hcp
MASDIFAKLGDIKGESQDAKHKDEIEVLSFSWGVANSGTVGSGSGSAAGKATLQDLSFVHAIDKATPALMKACATGKHLPEATLTQRKAGEGQLDYFVVKMKKVLVTSVMHGSSTGQPGSETVSVRFASVDLEYKAQKADGSLDAGVHFTYDVKTRKGGRR